jgi:predicted Zn-dependent peptidase
MAAAKKIILPNGLRLLLAPQPASLASTVLVLVEAGSEYETKRQNGISHFLEHLMFKGTTKRPKPGMISAEFDSLGAEYNAFTGQEYTGYWAKAQRHKLPQIFDLVSDLYLNPTFDPGEIEKERGVVIEEINMFEDTPMRRVQDLFTQLVYGDQPAGWDIAGRKEVIRTLKRNDFIAYRSKHYVAPATLVVVAGAFSANEMKQSVRKLFGGLPHGRRVAKPKTTERQTRPQTLVRFKESDQSHLVIGTRAFSIFDDRRYALNVLADVLGGGMSSRLFHRVREELGAAYYVRAAAGLSLDHGYLEVSAGVDNKKIELVIRAILEELRRLSGTLVPPDELKKAKDHMIGNLLLGLETSDELASYYGGQEILTRSIIEPQVLLKRIQAVTAEDIRRVARSLFRNNGLNLALIGPFKKQAPFQKLLKL